MNSFSGYNQIQIRHTDRYNMTFTTPWGTFTDQVMPFYLKNIGASFQWAINYIFHDLAHLILAYLDDATVRSKKWRNHLEYLRLVFQRCLQYNLRLNRLKCVFCVYVGKILGFIVSQQGIIVDPYKVQAIKEVTPLQTLKKLQSLQGKANFLRWFVPYYATCMHGFLFLLHQDIPFKWDDQAQKSFEALKEALTSAPLIIPPNYDKDDTLYLSTSKTALARVLIQDGLDGKEHVI